MFNFKISTIMKKNLIILSVAALLFAACQPKDVEPEKMFKTEDEIAQMLQAEPKGYVLYDEAKGGLNQFLKDFMTEEGVFEQVRERSKAGSNYLFTIDTIPTDTIGIYIRGRIVTDDAGGNFYKAMVIQQIVDGKQQALRLSVDLGNSSGMFAMGQEIIVRLNGLAIGRYANQPQICVPSFNNNLNAGSKYNEKVGWAPGRIPAARAIAAITRIGLPDISKLQYDEIQLKDFVTYTTRNYSTGSGLTKVLGNSLIDVLEARELDGRLVRINNIYFTSECANTQGYRIPCTIGDPETDGNVNVFGPTTGNVGYPQSRVVAQVNGTDSLFFMVATSEYAKYSHMYLPAAEYVGTVQGVLGYYWDNPTYDPTWKTWSVTPRDLTDIILKKGDEAWKPVEWEPAK